MLSNKLLRNIIIGLTSVTSLAACEKMIDIPAPITETSSSRVYSTDKLALAALSGAFSSTFNSISFAYGMTTTTSLVSDDVIHLSSTNFDELTKNTYLPTSSTSAVNQINDIWTSMYQGIYRFNSLIEGAQSSTALSDSVKLRLTSEAKFMRAYCYFYLSNLFGQVPLILETDVTKTSLAPKDSIAKINRQIIQDLVEARNNLTTNYSKSPGYRTVVTKWAACALLARVYLYNKQWELAELEASKVIDSAGLYSLIPSASLENCFVRANAEAIFQYGPYLSPTSGYTYEGSTFVTSSSQYSLTEDLYSTFSAADARKAKWIRDTTFSGVKNHQSFKYRATSTTNATALGRQEAPTVLRLAEQYLIRAEARVQQLKLAEGTADLDQVRIRANTGATTASSQDDLIVELAAENRREFFNEYGHRWLDLKRTGKINEVLGAKKPTWQARAAYFPLPQSAVDANPNLKQNDDY